MVRPLQLHDARRAEPLACREDVVGAGQAEAEVVRAREALGGRGFAGREGEQGPVVVAEDEQVLVVVDALREAEVLAVERRRKIAVRDAQRDVVEWQGARPRRRPAAPSGGA